MKRYHRFIVAAALVITGLGVLAPPAVNAAQGTPGAACDMRLRVELTPDVPDPREAGFVSSLLGNHPDYRLTLLRQDPENDSVIALDLTGPGPAAGCRAVVNSMRKDARVQSVAVQPGAATAVQPLGTAETGPDGGWVLKRAVGVSYARQASVRYGCDIWAVLQTGFDPTQDDGGVPPAEFTGKRAEYLRAEAACFEAHGYIVN